jgi:hypothetical protein
MTPAISSKPTPPTTAASAYAPRTELIASNTGMVSNKKNGCKRYGGGGVPEPFTDGIEHTAPYETASIRWYSRYRIIISTAPPMKIVWSCIFGCSELFYKCFLPMEEFS